MSTDLEAIIKFSPAREVRTKIGPRLLRTAKPTEAFWQVWKERQVELRQAGISVTKDRNGGWEVCEWKPLAQEVQAARTEALEASRATDAALDIPCPDGLAYMPFQRAGIAYALRVFGDLE